MKKAVYASLLLLALLLAISCQVGLHIHRTITIIINVCGLYIYVCINVSLFTDQEATSTAALDNEEAAAPSPISKPFGKFQCILDIVFTGCII